MGILEGFMYGILGGLLAELVGLFNLRKQAPGQFPSWLKSPFYWGVTAAMTGAGGVLVIIYLRTHLLLDPLIAVNVGASAPLIIGSLVAQAPKVTKID